MKTTQTCPKCAWKRIAVINRFIQPSPVSGNGTVAFPAVTVDIKGWIGDRETLGSFETWICERCGYTEMYAKDLGGLAELAARHPEQVRIVGS